MLAERLQHEPFTLIWTSDLLRAVETATIIASGRSIPVSKTSALREANFGELEGSRVSDLKTSSQWIQRVADKYAFIPGGGESYFCLENRLRPFLKTLANQIDEFPLIVTHVGVLRVLYRLLNNVPPTEAGRLDPHHRQIWEIRLGVDLTAMRLLDTVQGNLA